MEVLFAESQYECVENQHYDKTSDTLTLDAVVKRLTPIVFSQPIVENMENSAINPVELTQESEFNYNHEPSSSETHQVPYRYLYTKGGRESIMS